MKAVAQHLYVQCVGVVFSNGTLLLICGKQLTVLTTVWIVLGYQRFPMSL